MSHTAHSPTDETIALADASRFIRWFDEDSRDELAGASLSGPAETDDREQPSEPTDREGASSEPADAPATEPAECGCGVDWPTWWGPCPCGAQDRAWVDACPPGQCRIVGELRRDRTLEREDEGEHPPSRSDSQHHERREPTAEPEPDLRAEALALTLALTTIALAAEPPAEPPRRATAVEALGWVAVGAIGSALGYFAAIGAAGLL